MIDFQSQFPGLKQWHFYSSSGTTASPWSETISIPEPGIYDMICEFSVNGSTDHLRISRYTIFFSPSTVNSILSTQLIGTSVGVGNAGSLTATNPDTNGNIALSFTLASGSGTPRMGVHLTRIAPIKLQ